MAFREQLGSDAVNKRLEAEAAKWRRRADTAQKSALDSMKKQDSKATSKLSTMMAPEEKEDKGALDIEDKLTDINAILVLMDERLRKIEKTVDDNAQVLDETYRLVAEWEASEDTPDV